MDSSSNLYRGMQVRILKSDPGYRRAVSSLLRPHQLFYPIAIPARPLHNLDAPTRSRNLHSKLEAGFRFIGIEDWSLKPPEINLRRTTCYPEHPASIHLLKSETRSASQGSSGGIDPAETAPYTVCALAGTHIHAGSPRSTPMGFIHSMSSSRKERADICCKTERHWVPPETILGPPGFHPCTADSYLAAVFSWDTPSTSTSRRAPSSPIPAAPISVNRLLRCLSPGLAQPQGLGRL